MAKNRLGDNPLFSGETGDTFDAAKERESLGITLPEKKKGRPRKDDLVRTNAAQEGLTEEWQRATFIVSLKDALDEALDNFLEDKENLLPHK